MVVGPMGNFQKTITRPVSCAGIGVHGGHKARLCIKPAGVGHGIKFRRVDRLKSANIKADSRDAAFRDIPACARKVSSLMLGTTISNQSGDTVATIEHLMAACMGMGVDNLLIEIDGPEVPIMDGSARVFCELFEAAGLVEQGQTRKVLRILEPVEVQKGQTRAKLSPTVSHALSLKARIDFDNAVIGVQEASVSLNAYTFDQDIAFARTFGFSKDVYELQANGYARGGSLENSILIDDEQVVNPEGLRCEDEFVKHKLLDAIGDLALAGGRIAGHYEAERPGHAINNALVLKLLDTPKAWRWEQLAATQSAHIGKADAASVSL